MKKKLKQKKQINNALLDTSIQFDKFKPDSITSELISLASSHNLYTSYYVLYEFKSGLIKNLIDFYSQVNICGPQKAIARWGNKIAIREIKNIILLEVVITSFNEPIYLNNKNKFLDQIEKAIFHLLTNFETNLKGIIGDFKDDEIINFPINNKSDFDKFIKKLNARKEIIHQIDFWKKYSKELNDIVQSTTIQTNAKLKKVYKYLSEINADVLKSNKFYHNKAVGDAIIAIDAPVGYKIVSLDSSFETYCPILKKDLIKLRSTYFSK